MITRRLSIKPYVNILHHHEIIIILNDHIDMKNIALSMDEKVKEVDQLIQHLNSVEEIFVKVIQLPCRGNRVLLLLLVKEKRKVMDVENVKAKKIH